MVIRLQALVYDIFPLDSDALNVGGDRILGAFLLSDLSLCCSFSHDCKFIKCTASGPLSVKAGTGCYRLVLAMSVQGGHCLVLPHLSV